MFFSCEFCVIIASKVDARVLRSKTAILCSARKALAQRGSRTGGRTCAPTLTTRTRPMEPDYAQGLSAVRKTVIVLDSSPWKSWSENNDSYNRSGLSAEPAGPEMERRDAAEEPPCGGAAVLGKKRQTKTLRRETNRLICGHEALRWWKKSRFFFFLDFTALSWVSHSAPI